jgi:hypothetical protein
MHAMPIKNLFQVQKNFKDYNSKMAEKFTTFLTEI